MAKMEKADETALIQTLEHAGVSRADSSGVKLLEFGGPNGPDNDAVHFATNEKILGLINEGKLVRCLHVTGEMRALADPFHRRVCSEIRKRTGTKVSVVYNLPKDQRNTALGIAKWNADRWRATPWADRLSALNLIGENIVDAFSYDTEDKIQFTVFGTRYVQLQEKHADLGRDGQPRNKRVWLLESEYLHEALLASAQKIFKQGSEIPDALYKQVLVSLLGATSREIIRRLLTAENKVDCRVVVDDSLRYFDDAALEHLAALKVMGFIKSDASDALELTDIGRQYGQTLGI
jgi:hypothetical protein